MLPKRLAESHQQLHLLLKLKSMNKQVLSPQSTVRKMFFAVRSSLFAIRSSLFAILIRHSSFLIRNSFLLPYSSFLILTLISCSPSKRLERFLIRHPEFRHPDTLVLRDTITTPMVEADSSIHIERLYDTVLIEKEQLEVSLHRILDTLYINGKCHSDTIYTETRIPVEKIKLVKEPFTLKSLKPVTWLLITLIILILILSIVKRI